MAKSRGNKIELVGRPPLHQRELQQYLRVIAHFKRTTKYETSSYDTLEGLAKIGTAWNWDATTQMQMLVLSNAVGMPFPPRA
jgi:outer membrane translocation and assembly module TamA